MTKNHRSDELVVVTGAGGFIGGWLVRHLLAQGWQKIRAVDLKPLSEWFQHFPTVENVVADLRLDTACRMPGRGLRFQPRRGYGRNGIH